MVTGESPHRRRQARAIAISASIEASRKAVFRNALIAAASMAVLFEALSVAQTIWAASHP